MCLRYSAHFQITDRGIEMTTSTEQSNDTALLRPRAKKVVAISVRKIAANRQNALKSTGPKTTAGMAYSRQNAIKHGLFARPSFNFWMHGEQQEEYRQLLQGLYCQYQPVGQAEELEVERIAVCWWRLKRAWRYENAVNHVALSSPKQGATGIYWETFDIVEDAAIAKVQEKTEITEEMLSEFKELILASSPFIGLWAEFEKAAAKMCSDSGEKATNIPPALIVKAALDFLRVYRERRNEYTANMATDQGVIPNHEALDKILRYEAASDRSISRALDRLDRLQRNRKGE